MKELIKALSKARLEFTEPEQDRTATVRPRDSSKQEYSYNYSTLAEILSSIYPALGNHGLAILTPVEIRDDGGLYAVVTLFHESGESISSEFPMPPGLPAKDFGGVLKTVRRHLICSLLNISPSEEDGSNLPTPKGRSAQPKSNSKPKTVDESTSKPLTVQRINNAKKTYRLETSDIISLLETHGYPSDVYQLSNEQTDNLIEWMRLEAELRMDTAVRNGDSTLNPITA